jgi:hypothetical protein
VDSVRRPRSYQRMSIHRSNTLAFFSSNVVKALTTPSCLLIACEVEILSLLSEWVTGEYVSEKGSETWSCFCVLRVTSGYLSKRDPTLDFGQSSGSGGIRYFSVEKQGFVVKPFG